MTVYKVSPSDPLLQQACEIEKYDSAQFTGEVMLAQKGCEFPQVPQLGVVVPSLSLDKRDLSMHRWILALKPLEPPNRSGL